MPIDKFGRNSDTKTKDTGVSLTYINNNYIRSNGGTPVSSSMNMNGNTLYNVSDPVNPQDVATKEYVDDVVEGGPFLKENRNYKATHTINMAYNKLLNLHKPMEPYDAVTKDYVDYVDYNIKKNLDERLNTIDERLKTIDKRPHIIAVSANYCGELTEGEYQFAFGGCASKGSGFLTPCPGRIKKMKFRLVGGSVYKDSGEKAADYFPKGNVFSIMLFKKDKLKNGGNYRVDDIDGNIVEVVDSFFEGGKLLRNLF